MQPDILDSCQREVKYDCGEVTLGRADVNPAIYPKRDHVKSSASQFPRKRMHTCASPGGELPNGAKCVRVGKGASLGRNGYADPRPEWGSHRIFLADHPPLAVQALVCIKAPYFLTGNILLQHAVATSFVVNKFSAAQPMLCSLPPVLIWAGMHDY